MPLRASDESGFGVVELLIAMTVMAVGIFALVAGLSSGIETTKRASKASTAATLADTQMESYRRGTYAALAPLPDGTVTSSSWTPTGPDGRVYWVGTDIGLKCIFGGSPFSDTSLVPPALRCAAVTGPPAGPKSRPVTLVTLTVRDGSSSGPLLLRQSSTFEESSGS